MNTLKDMVDLVMSDITALVSADLRVSELAIEDKIVSSISIIAREFYEAKRNLDSFYMPLGVDLKTFSQKVYVEGRMVERVNFALLMGAIPELHGNLDGRDSRVFNFGGSALLERVSMQTLANSVQGLHVSGPMYAIDGTNIVFKPNSLSAVPTLYCNLILKDFRKHPLFSYDNTMIPCNNEGLEKMRYLIKRDALNGKLPQDPVVNAMDTANSMVVEPKQINGNDEA